MPAITPAPDLTAADIPRKSRQDKSLKPPTARWCYANPDGSTAFYICRWDKPDGKLIMPLVYGIDDSHPERGTGWHWIGPAPMRPLLYAPALAARPQCPVLLVEGEKTADAARAYLTKDWEVTTWSGGVNAIRQTDFSLLQGHPVIIWPDNDDAGLKAAAALSDILYGLDVAHAIVPLPALPPKWDLADPVPDTIGADAVAVLIARTLRDLTVPPEAAPLPYVNGHSHEPDPNIDTEIRVQCLGHRARNFYFIGAESQTVLRFSGRELQKMEALRELCSDDTYWYKQYGTNSENFNAGKVGAELIKRCYEAGIYDENNVRHRGCWMDNGRVVFHGGDRLLVDGVPCDPIAIKSAFIYPKLPRFFSLANTVPLTAKEGRALAAICHSLRWQNREPLTADLFVGFLATMLIAGALKFRSHGWISGSTGSGKSYVLREIAGRCVGRMSVIPLGSSTEAGIRQRLQCEPIPVLFDEAESHGPEGETRRQAIIQMMRISTQDSAGELLRGTAHHQHQGFRIQSQFLLASIGVGLREAADLNRCIVMTLDNPAAITQQEQNARIAEFAALDAKVRALPDDLAERILARMLPLIPAVRDLADRLSGILMKTLGASTIKRVGDLLATPLAGMWFLTHDAEPTDVQIDQLLARYNFRPWEGSPETHSDEAIELLRFMADQSLTVEFDHGSGKRTIGAILGHLCGVEYDSRLTASECKRVLAAAGIRYDHESRGIWLATKSDSLDQLFKRSEYYMSYQNILKRFRRARISEKPMWVGNKTARAIWLPIDAVIGERIKDPDFALQPSAPQATKPAVPEEDIPPGHPDYYEPGAEG